MFKYFRDLLFTLKMILKTQEMIMERLGKIADCVVTSPERMEQPRLRVDPNKY